MLRAFASSLAALLLAASAFAAELSAPKPLELPRLPSAAALPALPLAASAAAPGPRLAAAAELGALAPREAAGAVPGPAADERAQAAASFDGLRYPPTRRDESVVDDYFGDKVADPYRWLEDDNSSETKAWVEAQNQLAERYLAAIPERDQIEARLKQLWSYERRDIPSKAGKYWVYEKNDGLQNQDVLYKSRTLRGRPQVLLDPNTLSADGTAALSGTFFSDDGKRLAYGVSEAGSDWTEWRVRDVETGQDLPDVVRWTKAEEVSWSSDGQGFYYARYPQPKRGEELTAANENHKVYYHRLGRPQEQDELVFERPDHPAWAFGAGVSDDGRFLIVSQGEGTEPKSRVWVKDLKRPEKGFQPLFGDFDAQYVVVANEGDTFFVQTTKDAPRGKLIAVKLSQPRKWRTIIPQAKGRDVLQSVQRVGRRFLALWSVDAHNEMRIYGPRGGLQREVKLPGLGTVEEISRISSHEKGRGFFTYTSFNHPRTHFRLDVETGKTRVFWRPKIDVDPSRFEVRQVFYPSKDGTKIPMFIVFKKGLKLDGTNPTYLYGYGGFGSSETPYFASANATWLERGGVYAVANLRGGGEYGQEWHDAGRLANKQNVFDDFIAAAEYLIKEGYTSPAKLGIGGASNGGLLVGAAMTQRPDLFAAALPQVGVLDMLRFHRFTLGAGWKSDYASSETKEGFDTLIKYSPLHNLKPGTRYPATLVMTGDHDDRVVPAHSFKFAAELQRDQAGPGPALIRVEKDAGHGAGKPLAKEAREIADMWAFLLKAFGLSKGS